MASEHVIYKVEDGIAIITLSKPERLNAVDPDMRKEIGGCVEKAGEDDAVKVLVITGEGKAFCAGGDVKTMPGRMEKTIIERRDSLRASNLVIRKIRELEKLITSFFMSLLMVRYRNSMVRPPKTAEYRLSL